MLDAFSKIPEGILSGHSSTYGDFDECLAVRPTITAKDNHPNFKGKHCTGILAHPQFCANNTQLVLEHIKIDSAIDINTFLMPTVGVCMPSSCSKQEIQRFVRNALGFHNQSNCIIIRNCETDNEPVFKTNEVIIW